ncbi:MAG: glycosyltransferase family 4 protein [Sulfobacillus sp.]
MAFNTVYVNGRFLTQSITGVQRYAQEALDAIDDLLGKAPYDNASWTVLAPKGTRIAKAWKNIRFRNVGHLHGHIWEQFELPWYASDGLLLTLCGAPSVFHRRHIPTIHDAAIYDRPDGYSFLYRAYYRIIYRLSVGRSLAIFTVSEFSRNRIAEVFQIPKERIIVTYNGADHITRSLPSEDASALISASIKHPYILAVSSMNPNKNFAIVAKLAELLANSDIRIVVAGGTNPRVFGNTGSMPDNVQWLGYVSDDDLKALYRNATCFIFPSLYEGFGLPPIEAMALGCPVIASNAASIQEICGDAALYFSPTSPEDIKRKVMTILRDKPLTCKMSIDGIKHAEQYIWSRVADTIIKSTSHLLRI